MLIGEDVVTETNCPFKPKQFTVALTSTTFELLSNSLYANPVLAIVRELLTNAYDAQKSVGNENTPIDVHFPTVTEPEFSIRDYGSGLSKEDINTIYTTFFDSTKNNDNKYTGGFGLGSKTPFAYTSSFTIVSYYNGVKYTYLASKLDGIPSIILTFEEPTKEPNGLYINIPCDRNKSRREFLDAANEYLEYMPEIHINPLGGVDKDYIFCNKNHYTYKNLTFYPSNTRYYYRYNIKIKQGQNIYSIPNEVIPKLDFSSNNYENATYRLAKSATIIVNVPIGTLEITPSREELRVSTNNITHIIEVFEEVKHTINNEIKEILPNIKNIINKEGYESLIVEPINTGILSDNEASCNLALGSSNDNMYYLSAITSFYGKNYIDGAVYSNNISFSNKRKQIVIYLDSITNYGGYNALDIVLDNYEDLKDVDIHLAYLNDAALQYYGKRNSNILCYLRKVKNTIFILNNLEDDLKFNIEEYFIKDFYKKYPRLLDKEEKRKQEEETIYVKPNKTIYHKYCAVYFLNSGQIDFRHCIKDSLVVSSINKKEELEKLEKSDYQWVLITDENKPLYHNEEFNNMMDKFESSTYCTHNFGILTELQNLLNTTKTQFVFFTVAKTNMKLFKDNYKHIDVTQIRDIVYNNLNKLYIKEELDWPTRTNSRIDMDIDDLKSNIENQSPKHQKIILNSKWYKKHILIKQYITKVQMYKYTSEAKLNNLKKFLGDKYTVNYTIIPAIYKYLSEKTRRGYTVLLDYGSRRKLFKAHLIEIFKTLN